MQRLSPKSIQKEVALCDFVTHIYKLGASARQIRTKT